MNKLFCLALATAVLLSGDYGFNGSTTSVVTLVGGVIKATHVDNNKKYKRKDCPVCKGKGWYISGDGIEKVTCGYCEEEKSSQTEDSTVIHPPVMIPAKKR